MSSPVTAGPQPDLPRRRSKVGVALLLLVVIGTVVAAALVALDQRSVAATWQERSVLLEADRDGVVRERDELATRLDRALDALGTSEADVAQLEARVLELAEEKARAEDTATTVEVERDVFIELSELIAEATTALDTCVTQLLELQVASVDAFNRANQGLPVDVGALNARSAEVTGFCEEARSSAASAQTAADQLLRP